MVAYSGHNLILRSDINRIRGLFGDSLIGLHCLTREQIILSIESTQQNVDAVESDLSIIMRALLA